MVRNAVVTGLTASILFVSCSEIVEPERQLVQLSEVGYLDTYYGWFVSDLDGWLPDVQHYGNEDDGTPGDCPPRFHYRSRGAKLEIQSIGIREFWFKGPFERLAQRPDYPHYAYPNRALYRSYDGIGLADPEPDGTGRWFAEGPLVLECKRIGPASSLHAHFARPVGFQGTFHFASFSLGSAPATSGGSSFTCEYGTWSIDYGCSGGQAGQGSGGGGGGITRVEVCVTWIGPETMGVECTVYYL